MRLGAHVDSSRPLAEAAELGAGVVQIMLGDPRKWGPAEVASPGGAAALRAEARDAGVTLFVHAPYVINVASPNNRVRIPSRNALARQLAAAAEIGAAGVVVHGGHVGADDDARVGLDNWRKCVERLQIATPLLIENTAGGANAMARGVERIATLWEAVGDVPGVGFCLDTCHAHAGGDELVGLVDRVLAVTGRIDLVHCNDSRDAFGSGADRHANLGEGQADPDGIVAVVAQAGAPVVLETPGGVPERLADLAWLRARLPAS